MSSIQFGCQGCGQRLKVPEGSEGKQVRCPECETVNVIPADTEPAESPFVAPPSVSNRASQQQENPFSAPTTEHAPEPVPVGNLSHHAIEFGDVFEQAWGRYKVQFGMGAVFGIVFFGISIAVGIGSQILQAGAAVTESAVIILFATVFGFVVQQLSLIHI